MYAIVWSETRRAGVVAARMEGKRLAAMTVLADNGSLTVGLRALRAPAQFIVTKQGEEAQTGPAEYLATSAIMSKGDYSFEAQCSLPGLTTAASAHQADQSLQDQSSPNIMASNHLRGDWAKAPLPRPSYSKAGVYKM